jgi:hypothetical protein
MFHCVHENDLALERLREMDGNLDHFHCHVREIDSHKNCFHSASFELCVRELESSDQAIRVHPCNLVGYKIDNGNIHCSEDSAIISRIGHSRHAAES